MNILLDNRTMINGIKEISVVFGEYPAAEKVTHYSDILNINQNGLKYSHIAHGTENYYDSMSEDFARDTKNILLEYSVSQTGFSQAEFDWYFTRLTKHIKDLGNEPSAQYEAGKPTVVKIEFADGGTNSFSVPINLLSADAGKIQRKVGKYLRKLVSNVVVIDNLLTEDELKVEEKKYKPLPASELEDMDIFEPYPDNL